MDNKLLAEIKASLTILEPAMQNSGVSVSVQDLNLRFIRFYETHSGWAGEDMIGKFDTDWLPANEAAKLIAIKRRALEGKSGVKEMFKSTPLAGREGDAHYNIIRVEAVREGGEIVGICTIAIDITEFQQALNTLEGLNERLLEQLASRLDA